MMKVQLINMFNSTLFYLGRYLLQIYSKIMLRINLLKHEKFSSGSKIIVSNHPTTSDPFILTALTKGRISILIANHLFNVPLFGRYLKFIGHIPVIEGKGRIAFDRAIKLLKKGITVIIFIEGDLSEFINRVIKVRTGAVRLALETGNQIIPVGISLGNNNLKSISSNIDGKKYVGRWFLKGKYAITFGKPFTLFGNINNYNQVRHLSNSLMEKINLLIKESAERLIKKRIE